ncbi:hypothetical protein THAOC_24234, partial [Thalassiosira oceanica]
MSACAARASSSALSRRAVPSEDGGARPPGLRRIALPSSGRVIGRGSVVPPGPAGPPPLLALVHAQAAGE